MKSWYRPPKKLSRETAARLGGERVAPGQAVPLHPQAVAFAGHYGFDIDVLAAYRPTRKGRVRAAGFEPVAPAAASARIGRHPAPRRLQPSTRNTGPIQTAIGYAVAQLGKPYIWGGAGPVGYDCSAW